MGSAAARSLAKRGLDTVLLERFAFGHTRGSSHGPTRIFRIAYPDPMYSRMARRALDLWRGLEAGPGGPPPVPTRGAAARALAPPAGPGPPRVGGRVGW